MKYYFNGTFTQVNFSNVLTVFSLFSSPRWAGPFEEGLIGERGLIEGGGGLMYSSKKPAMEVISLNCNKLKISTQYTSYNHIAFISFLSLYYGGGLFERGAYFIFSLKRGLIREGRLICGGGGLNREIKVSKIFKQ